MKCLIVEDNFTNRKLLQMLLGPYGECDIAVDGEEALEAFKSAIEARDHYDLICLDVMMPNMDGQEALKKIREMEDKAGICGTYCVKVVMTTALADKENVMQAFRSQADAYLVKPLLKETLFKELKQLELIE